MFERNGFADTAAAHDDAGFATLDEEADVIENRAAVEAFADLLEFKVIGSIICGSGVDGLKLGRSFRWKNGFWDRRKFNFQLRIG